MRTDITESTVKDLYIKDKLTIHAISKKLNCSPEVVKKRLGNLYIQPESHLIQHHIKYKEIHGEDKVVLMTVSEHRRLHNRLRREGKCNIPAEELLEISRKARLRTDGCKARTKKYKELNKDKIKEWFKQHNEIRNKLPEIKEIKLAYKRKAEKRVVFYDNIGTNTLHSETIIYNILNGNVYVVCRFQGNHGFSLPIIEEATNNK